uniref:GTPase ObgE n=1 Tax=Ndongobacter massiliensis TaxID=1871025 RepID=UPI0009302778|nr:GTPase ObgE [Ndongobacter massiliensis]
MFIDTARITVEAGNGGDGAIAWRREKYEPSGGPDGGDGGDGGSVFFEADKDLQTLLDFRYHTKYRAESGERGKKKKMFGKKGADLILKVPMGTTIREAESRKLIADLKEDGQRFLAVRGGHGGKGNARFKNSIRQAPRFAKPGGLGQKLEVLLEVKLIADVGLVGLPNVGKSSLLSILSNAKPKIADYHFTTLEPNLGVMQLGEGRALILADIPGLIEGAHEGTGLGHDFLRHIERTRFLVHVLDMSGYEGRDPVDDFRLIQDELEAYQVGLAQKVRLVVANKSDLPQARENLRRFQQQYPQYPVLCTSAATTQGIAELKHFLQREMAKAPEQMDTTEPLTDVAEFFRTDPSLSIYREGSIIYCKGEPLQTLTRKLLIEDEDSVTFFENSLETMGVMEQIRALHPAEEDVIDVEGFQFEWL